VKVPFSFETEHVPNPHDGSFGEAFSFGTCSRTEQRSRGYADLDPELAWEQWRAMRAQG
jgi:hypothetical protein